jgi:hypothetical protein
VVSEGTRSGARRQASPNLVEGRCWSGVAVVGAPLRFMARIVRDGR